MNKKYFTIASLVFPIFVLFVWTLSLSIQKTFLPEVTVRITGYDPRDLLSGHYISYVIDWGKTDCTQFEDAICPKREFSTLRKYDSSLRYYIPEENAKELDSILRRGIFNKHRFEVVYSYKKGLTPRASELLIDGKKWQDVIK